jgi:hypothetical protein
MRYHFYFYHDVIEPNQSADLDPQIEHRQLVIVHGQISLGMQTVRADDGIYFRGGARLAGPLGLARCEIVAEVRRKSATW